MKTNLATHRRQTAAEIFDVADSVFIMHSDYFDASSIYVRAMHDSVSRANGD